MTKKKIRARFARAVRSETGLSMADAARIARVVTRFPNTVADSLERAARRGVPGVAKVTDYLGGCGDPRCCVSVDGPGIIGPRGSMTGSQVSSALVDAREPLPARATTPRKPRARKPLACAGCGRVVPEATIAEAKRLGKGLRCGGCGTRRPPFAGTRKPASPESELVACMEAAGWLA